MKILIFRYLYIYITDDGYNSFHKFRFFIMNDNPAIKIPALCNCNIKICTVEVCLDKKALIIVSIYRPHSGTIEKFISELNNVLKNSVVQGLQCIITGVFNIDVCSDTNEVHKFFINMQSYSLMPIITKPTHFPPNYRNPPSLLDHIWTNHLSIYKSELYYTI